MYCEKRYRKSRSLWTKNKQKRKTKQGQKKKTRRKKTNMLKKREKNYDVEIKEGKRRKKK